MLPKKGWSGIVTASEKRATIRFASSGMIFILPAVKSCGRKPLRVLNAL